MAAPDTVTGNHQSDEEGRMSDFKKGQAVIFTNPRKQEKRGKFVEKIDIGPGKGGGVYLVVDVDGVQYRGRPSTVRAA